MDHRLLGVLLGSVTGASFYLGWRYCKKFDQINELPMLCPDEPKTEDQSKEYWIRGTLESQQPIYLNHNDEIISLATVHAEVSKISKRMRMVDLTPHNFKFPLWLPKLETVHERSDRSRRFQTPATVNGFELAHLKNFPTTEIDRFELDFEPKFQFLRNRVTYLPTYRFGKFQVVLSGTKTEDTYTIIGRYDKGKMYPNQVSKDSIGVILQKIERMIWILKILQWSSCSTMAIYLLYLFLKK